MLDRDTENVFVFFLFFFGRDEIWTVLIFFFEG